MIQPESRPDVTKGLTMSLYAQGFQQAASGLTPRPKVYAQDRVTEFLAPHILKRTSFGFDCRMDWRTTRTTTLQTCDWQFLCERIKRVRRVTSEASFVIKC